MWMFGLTDESFLRILASVVSGFERSTQIKGLGPSEFLLCILDYD